jgi:hypothetical protein
MNACLRARGSAVVRVVTSSSVATSRAVWLSCNILKRAGVLVGAWRGGVHACVAHLCPSLCGHMNTGKNTGKSCIHGALPAVIPARRGLPHRSLLPQQIHTRAHDCVHTSPCILWCAQTWHASILQQVVALAPSSAMHRKLGSRAPSGAMHSRAFPPAVPTSAFAATSAPWSSSVCTTARCPQKEARCKVVSPF